MQHALAAALAAAFWLALGAWAAPSPTATKAELDELRARIGALQQDIQRSEAHREDASDQLRETESAISESNRRLRELNERQQAARTALAAAQAQSRELETRIAVRQRQLSDLLYHRYLSGRSEGLGGLLGAEEPNQAARDLIYLRHLARAQAELIQELRRAAGERQHLADEARRASEEIAALFEAERRERADLLAQRGKRQAAYAQVAGRLRTQRREVETLRRSQQRLEKLVQGLGRLPRRPPERQPAPAARPSEPSVASPPLAPPTRPEEPAADRDTDAAFARLKGSLPAPARGELSARFGAPRSGGGPASRGIFIRAAEGGEVRAVAAGQVVYADWLRGFGNLLIIDHGGGYLTVYGNNETLYKGVGARVASGESVATIGASGGSEESGLYFEIRHQGQALDPMRWVNVR